MRTISRLMCSIAAMAGIAACGSDSTTASGTGTLELRITDAPSDDFESATIFVSSVYVKGGTAGATESLVSSTKASFDLMTLQNGVTASLASATVAAGSYSQIRLVVDSARVVLKAGKTFADGSTTARLQVPSGSESGLKINFAGPVTVSSGTATAIVDFDVAGSFILQGPRDAPTGCLFRPLVHAVSLGLAATISGTVTPGSANAMVYAIAGTDTVSSAQADAGGNYTLRFLPAGTYVAAAAATGFSVAVSLPITLTSGQTMSGVNLVLVAVP